MNSFEQKIKQGPKIETIKTPEGNEVSFSPERGGIITSIKFNGKEILYLDEETFNNIETNVKGGVPILFPNAGPIPDEIKTEEFKDLKQHGFARNLKWDAQKTPDGFIETLNSNEQTDKIYPYKFKLTIQGKFDDNNSFTIMQIIENLETDKDMPVSSGLHPYFKVLSEEIKKIKFKELETIEEQIKKWGENIKAISTKNPNKPMEVEIPGLGTLIFEISEEYKRVWVWSQEGKDFICIEPVMRDKGGIVSDPEIIKPGEKLVLSFKIKNNNENKN
jgi:galactose mutarotase-like enzyme